MLYRIWSKLRTLVMVLAVFFVVTGAHAVYADCEITKVSFDSPHSFFLDEGNPNVVPVPFYEGYGKQSSIKKVIISANSDPSCEGKSVYLTIFSSTRKVDPDTPSSPDKPLENVTNKQFQLVKASEGLTQDDPSNYGITVSFYSAEENCFDYSSGNLKSMVQNSIAAGGSKQSDYDDLNTTSTKKLYDYLIQDIDPGTFTADDLWSIKKVVYRKFNKSVDCGYYARAQLNTPMNVNALEEGGRPIARLVAADFDINNFEGFMCDYRVGIFCDSTAKWKQRSAYNTSGSGVVDVNDKCTQGETPIPGCYELLAPIPGLGDTVNFDGGPNGEPPFALDQFFSAGINIVIGAVSVLAVLALMYYGFTMMRDRSRGNVPGMKANKERLMNVFWGIGIILGSYVILNTINPALLVLSPNLESVTLNSNAELIKNISDSGFQFSGTGGAAGQLPDPTKYEIKNISYAGTKSYMKSHYFPAMGKALPTTPKGIRTLMAAHTYMEGFYPNTKGWRTNNPGNIGNKDDGSTRSFATLEEGIIKQYDHFTNTVINAKKGGAYYVGRHIKDGGGLSDLKDKNGNRIPYPAVDFTYDGTLHQYLAIYATAGRMDNTYLSFFISYFKSEGITITPFTKMTEIASMN